MCERFGLDRVRFTNSGTEANLLAITPRGCSPGARRCSSSTAATTAASSSSRRRGALERAVPLRASRPTTTSPATTALIEEHEDDLAAVLVEPMLGSGGCIPAEPDVPAAACSTAAREAGAVCIADEVMTSRHGRSGLAALLGAEPDLRTFGKYIGGGFSFGAFGGQRRADGPVRHARPGAIPHAGTFNNNVATMAAGCVVLGELYTADVAEAHTARGERFRAEVAGVLGAPPAAGHGHRLRLDARAPRRHARAPGAALPRPLPARDLHGAARDGQPEPAADRRAARRPRCRRSTTRSPSWLSPRRPSSRASRSGRSRRCRRS